MQSSSLKFRSILPLNALALSGLLLAGAGLSSCSEEENPVTGPGGNSDGLITLTSPRGGETFKVRDTVWVKWTVKADPDAPTAVDPKFSPDSGKTWTTIRVGGGDRLAPRLRPGENGDGRSPTAWTCRRERFPSRACPIAKSGWRSIAARTRICDPP